ncbi:MAG: glycosyltransferase [Alphaproteobacteria bacterium]|nr:glycosyltransferase [Alphaproteobacteria bacterium]
MRVLLSTIGSRGDVQPLVALAFQLRLLGVDVRLCVPPDFQDWIKGLGMEVRPIGPELRWTAKPPAPVAMPTPEQRRQMMDETVSIQFRTITEAAEGCDVIVGATALQIAAPSVAEKMGVPYVFAAYCPTVLPSSHHAPPVLAMRGDTPATNATDFPSLWTRDAERFSALFGPALNANRAALGLTPVEDVRAHVFTSQPWLAADKTLAPWPDSEDEAVFQTGAWILPDQNNLSPELEAFLDAGEPPVYFGFGSIRAPENVAAAMIGASRALGRRAIVSRGWADLSLVDDQSDCFLAGEVNQLALFRRVAAVVHHGGAGTTTAAALCGAPQVIAPQVYDQHHWAQQIERLGVGAAHPPEQPTALSLATAIQRALQPVVVGRARSLSADITIEGARCAAERLISGDLPIRF